MILYVHKVRCNIIDGWGRDRGISTETLGHYKDKKKAEEDKKKRDESTDHTYCDIGESWIEEAQIKE